MHNYVSPLKENFSMYCMCCMDSTVNSVWLKALKEKSDGQTVVLVVVL